MVSQEKIAEFIGQVSARLTNIDSRLRAMEEHDNAAVKERKELVQDVADIKSDIKALFWSARVVHWMLVIAVSIAGALGLDRWLQK